MHGIDIAQFSRTNGLQGTVTTQGVFERAIRLMDGRRRGQAVCSSGGLDAPDGLLGGVAAALPANGCRGTRAIQILGMKSIVARTCLASMGSWKPHGHIRLHRTRRSASSASRNPRRSCSSASGRLDCGVADSHVGARSTSGGTAEIPHLTRCRARACASRPSGMKRRRRPPAAPGGPAVARWPDRRARGERSSGTSPAAPHD